MKPLVVVDENIRWLEHFLGDHVDIHALAGRSMQPDDLAGASALLVRSVTSVNETLLAGTGVKFVGSATSGIDHVDTAFLERAGIAFAYAPGSNGNSVVEYVLSAIAAVDDRLENLLGGGRVGIVGYGVIGRMLGERLSSLGISWCAFDPWLQRSLIAHPGTLEEVLDCEVVSLHAELTRRQPWPSFHLLAEPELMALRTDALLINASRGAVIDNRALLGLLESKRLSCDVVLDVWEGEPNISADLLRRVRYGSPHVAGYSLDGKILATRMLCDELAQNLRLMPPASGAPVEPPGEISLDTRCSDADFLRQLLHARYDIAVDDLALRERTLDHSAERAAAAFDRLRRDYRPRRELPGTVVSGEGISERRLGWLEALGCRPLRETSS